MKNQYKPENYNSVAPYFCIEGAQKLADFLHHLFEAEELRKYVGHDGKIIHMEVRIDDSIVMLGDSTETNPPKKQNIHVYVSDVDTIFKRAVELGCVPLQDPVQKDGEPDRRCVFIDFAGNLWSVGTQLK
jgi:uncharacterized glyoxalase superfamily protein PhnB